MELDAANMASLLAFDSRSIMHILEDVNEKYFDDKFPVIYKNKIKKKTNDNYFITSPIDVALKSNQVRAVDKMIEYIVKY